VAMMSEIVCAIVANYQLESSGKTRRGEWEWGVVERDMKVSGDRVSSVWSVAAAAVCQHPQSTGSV